MCGIVGFIDKNSFLKEGDYQPFLKALINRGPDNQSYETYKGDYGNCLLGHTRLSIIDLSESANQPMVSKTSSHTIVFNGEIYNYKELQETCKKEGVTFDTNSDTEAILKTFELKGIEQTLELLDGMFAFCIFNQENGDTFIARDRYGQKPLYYGVQNDVFSFSSDIRTFAQIFPELSINETAFGYLFSEMSTPRELSIWNEVKKLKAGHYLKFNGGSIDIQRYWAPDYNQGPKHKSISFDKVDQLITEGVKKRLVADVPVGTFLSGGVDSSLITAIAARELGKKIDTFSVGFSYEQFNELPFAKIVADKYNTNHHELTVDPSDFDVVDSLINEFGEPFADSSMIPTAFVSKFAKSQVSVALGGDGGDELFCGYPTYNQALLMTQRSKKLGAAKPLVALGSKLTSNSKVSNLNELLNNESLSKAKSLNRSMGFTETEMKLLFKNSKIRSAFIDCSLEAVKESEQFSNNLFDSVWYTTLQTRLVNDYLVKVDKASMFHSLEVRSPFLDKDLFAHVRNYTPDQLLTGGVNKYILKKIAERYVPKEVLYRKKMGFGIPIGQWFRNELKDNFVDLVLNKRQTKIDLNYDFVEQLFNDHLKGNDHSHKLWILFVFHKWIKQWDEGFQLAKFF